MSERFPSSAVSHAELDKDLYKMDVSDAALLDQRAEAAAIGRVQQEQYQASYEKQRHERAQEELAAGAIRAYQATEHSAHYAAQAEAREQAATEDGAMRAYRAREAGQNMDPTLSFRQQQREYALADEAHADAGRVDTLNAAFSRELEKVTDEEGSIDVSKLNKNELIRYRSSINWLTGEDAASYDKRMQEVFKTPNYIETIAQILTPQDIATLQRIEARIPGANPLAASLTEHFKNLETQEQQAQS